MDLRPVGSSLFTEPTLCSLRGFSSGPDLMLVSNFDPCADSCWVRSLKLSRACVLALCAVAAFGSAGCRPKLHSMESVGIKSYDTVLKNSLRKDKPLLIIISASWCGACNAMESGLMEPAARRALEQTASFKLDFDSPRTKELRDRFYGGGGVPEMILISNEGKELLRERGWAGSENFSSRLREAISKN